ncbi:MAG: hypothetical protein ACLR0N_14130 [Bilophila wadsworthia]
MQAASGSSARRIHDLPRLHEVHNLLTIGRCTVDAALYRQESRFGNCHSARTSLSRTTNASSDRWSFPPNPTAGSSSNSAVPTTHMRNNQHI